MIETIKGCKVIPDLKDAVKSGSPIAFLESLKYQIACKKVEDKIEEFRKEYNKLYKNEAGFYKEKYVICIDIKDGVKVFDKDCYEVRSTEDLIIPLHLRPLKEECKKLIKTGKAIPSEEFFIQQKMEELNLDKVIKNITKEELIEYGFNPFDATVTYVADLIHDKVSKMLAQKAAVTEKQEKRYQTKYQIAKRVLNGETEAKKLLLLEAKLLGMDVKDYASIIVKMGDDWRRGIEYYETKIEAFRVAVKNAYKENPIAAVNILIEANNLKPTATDEEIAAIFAKHLGK